MFTGTTLDTPEKKLSRKQKAHRTKSMVELDKLIRELEKIQMTTPLMFVDQEASINVPSLDTVPELETTSEMDSHAASATNHNKYSPDSSKTKKMEDSLGDSAPFPILRKNYEIPEPKFEHHYLIPTVSSSLPIYLQGENERIRSSYRSHTCWTIKKLPNTLMTGEVQRIRRQHAVENLVSTSSNTFKPASLLKARDFDKPEYIGTDFDKMKNLNKIQVEQEKIRIDSYSRRPFVVSSRIRAKFEDIFNDDSYQFAYMGPGGNVVKLDAITRGCGAGGRGAAGAGGDGSTSQGLTTGITPKSGGKYEADLSMIKTWVTKLHEQISKDWSMFSFRIRYTPTQEILIQFAYPKSNGQGATQMADGTGIIPPFPPPNNALNKYMHQLASHGLANQFNLAKRGDRWHVVERDWIDSTSTVTAASSASPYSSSSQVGDIDLGQQNPEFTTGRDTNNSSLTSSQGSLHPSTNNALEQPTLRHQDDHVSSTNKETVQMTEGGLLEEDTDGNRWFRPLPHYHHFNDPTQPAQDANLTSTEPISNENNFSSTSSPPRMKKSVSFSQLETIDPLKEQTSPTHDPANGEVLIGNTRPFQDPPQQKPLLRRRLSSSMPLLETMLEETSSQMSSKSSTVIDKDGDHHQYFGPHGSGSLETAGMMEDNKYTDYLTFSFYTPWVSCRQTNTAKYYAQQDRFHAREKLRLRQEKQAKLLAELDAAIAEEKARASRHRHHHHHHGPHHHGHGHQHHNNNSSGHQSSFSVTDAFLSGISGKMTGDHHGNALHHHNHGSGVPSSNSSSASAQVGFSNVHNSNGHHMHSLNTPNLSRQNSVSSSVCAFANGDSQQQQRIGKK